MTPRHFNRALPIIIMLIAAMAPAQAQKKGFLLTSREGGFTVRFPAGFKQPKLERSTTESESGDINTTTYTTDNSRGACLVSFSRYPDELVADTDPETMIDGARNGALAGMEEGVESQEDFTIGGHTARSVIFSAEREGTQLYSRFIWVVKLPYLFQVAFVAYDRDELDRLDIKAYFDSFAFTKGSKR